MSEIGEIAKAFMASGGKRLRPRACAAIYRHLTGSEAQPRGFENLLEALECFHKASLIHDDIQDGDEVRYGRPTVWKEHGIAVAIAAGDWLVACGYQAIGQSGLANASAMISATIASHLRLCEGQGSDLLAGEKGIDPAKDEARYLSMCACKTGEPFALAGTLAALTAGQDPATWHNWGITFGTLFQIRDDLADKGACDTLRKLEAEWVRRLADIKEATGFEFLG